jgi:hypothetical protein
MKRLMYLIDSFPEADVELEDEQWYLEHRAKTRCKGCSRWRPGVPYSPIHILLRKKPQTLIDAGSAMYEVMHRPLAETLVSYGRGVVLGTVRMARTGELFDDWATIYGKRESELIADRGRYSRLRQCKNCGAFVRLNGWAHYVIVERYLDSRWLYLDGATNFFVDARLIAEENLKERFPTLRFYPIPVVPEPLDGQVLPGDPGWSGEFKQLPIPKPPNTKPERGIGLWL